MTTPHIEPGAAGKATRPEKKRETLLQFQQRIANENPELLNPWDDAALAAAASDSGIPANVARENMQWAFQLNRRHIDPEYAPARRTGGGPTKEARAAAVAAAERRAREERKRGTEHELKNYGPDTIMGDGRRLDAWTVGEVRALGGVFAFICDIAGTTDDSRVVGKVMSKKDWRRAATK